MNRVKERLETIAELNKYCEAEGKVVYSALDDKCPAVAKIDMKLREIAKSKNRLKDDINAKHLTQFVLDNYVKGNGYVELFKTEGKLEWYVESLIDIYKDLYIYN